jgi:uncharacterized membrane protein (UPF0127 family)
LLNNNRRARSFAALACLAAFALLATAWLGAPGKAGPAFERLEIVTANGTHAFKTEVARTPAERAKGLMYRHDLPRDRAMLFDFGVEQKVMMWMKNTYVPLDMIFVSRDGRVVSIFYDAKPMSEAIISSEQPAYAAIEVRAGVARRIGVAVGDAVRHPIFKE